MDFCCEVWNLYRIWNSVSPGLMVSSFCPWCTSPKRGKTQGFGKSLWLGSAGSPSCSLWTVWPMGPDCTIRGWSPRDKVKAQPLGFLDSHRVSEGSEFEEEKIYIMHISWTYFIGKMVVVFQRWAVTSWLQRMAVGEMLGAKRVSAGKWWAERMGRKNTSICWSGCPHGHCAPSAVLPAWGQVIVLFSLPCISCGSTASVLRPSWKCVD